MIRRIHATYRLSAPAAARATAERVHAMHAERCPIYRSLYRAIAITTELQFEAVDEPGAGGAAPRELSG